MPARPRDVRPCGRTTAAGAVAQGDAHGTPDIEGRCRPGDAGPGIDATDDAGASFLGMGVEEGALKKHAADNGAAFVARVHQRGRDSEVELMRTIVLKNDDERTRDSGAPAAGRRVTLLLPGDGRRVRADAGGGRDRPPAGR